MKELSSAEEHCLRVYNKALENKEKMKMKNKMTSDSINNTIGQNNNVSNDNKNNSNSNTITNSATNNIIDNEGEEKNNNEMLNIYITLFKVMIDTISKGPGTRPTQQIPGAEIRNKDNHKENDVNEKNSNSNLSLNDVLNLAEKCHDRFDALSFLSLLPKNIPLYKTEKYLRMVLEFENHKKRNLMVSTF